MGHEPPGSRFPSVLVVALGAATLALGSGATAAATASVPRCSPTQLKAWAGPTTGTAGGQQDEFAFVNASAHACSLIGYPKLQMLNAAGKTLPTTDTDAGPSAFPRLGVAMRVVQRP